MSGFGTDAELMERCSCQIDEVKCNIESAVQKLHCNLEPVLVVWQGGASDVFRRLMDQFGENAKTINQKLGELSENILCSGRGYVQLEEEHAQEMSKIEGLLGG